MDLPGLVVQRHGSDQVWYLNQRIAAIVLAGAVVKDRIRNEKESYVTSG